MSYQEKRTITSMITGALVLAAYCVYAFGKFRSGVVAPDDLKFWAVTMLTFIGIGIAAAIVIQIIFHILLSISIAVKQKIRNEHCDDKDLEKMIEAEIVEDEMDKLIELKAMRLGFAIAGVGFIASLLALVFTASAVLMLNILFISFSAGSLVEGVGQLIYYRRGV